MNTLADIINQQEQRCHWSWYLYIENPHVLVLEIGVEELNGGLLTLGYLEFDTPFYIDTPSMFRHEFVEIADSLNGMVDTRFRTSLGESFQVVSKRVSWREIRKKCSI